MNLSSLFKVLSRHKMVVIPVALVSLIACIAVVFVTGKTYRASAAVVLLNPPALPEVTPENPTVPPEFQNPYARFGDLSVIVDILVKVLGSEEVGSRLKAEGLDGTFEIAANRDFYRGPIVDVATESSSEEQAKKNAQLVIDEMQAQLTDLQSQQGTDPTYFIKPLVIVAPDHATRVLSGTLRLLIVVVGLGVVATLGSALAADALDRRRARLAAEGGDDFDEDDDA